MARSQPAPEVLKERAKKLGLYGVLARWETYGAVSWLPELLKLEEDQRQVRTLDRRVRGAQLGRFKPLADFDWSWPEEIDREQIEELFTLDFLEGGGEDGSEPPGSVLFIATSGLGKTMLAKNLVYQALLKGYTARFTSASAMLNDLASQESAAALERRLRCYTRPRFLGVDEVGYLSYNSRHADLLFEVVSRRSEEKSTLVTTNRVPSEWNEVFPNATSVVALVDRLVQRAEVVRIKGKSYRLKEAQERQAKKAAERKAKRSSGSKKGGK
jgi:DNA replication protein DnaC